MAVFFRNDAWWTDTYVKGKRVRRKIGPDKKTAELVEQDLISLCRLQNKWVSLLKTGGCLCH